MNENFRLGTIVLNEILDKCKTHGDKRGLRYFNKDEIPTSGETMFVKGKDKILNQTSSSKNPSLCTHQKKIGHTSFRCYTKFLERFESQISRLMNGFNSLRNNILKNEKLTIRSLEVNQASLSHHLELNKFR